MLNEINTQRVQGLVGYMCTLPYKTVSFGARACLLFSPFISAFISKEGERGPNIRTKPP